MPYKLIPVAGGFKVAKKSDRRRVFSGKPLTKDKAIKQMRAIILSERDRNAK